MPITQINDGNGLNSAGGSSIRNSSKFINKFPICGTYTFGRYIPNFAAETVADDKHTIHLGHNVISNTLAAPLLQDVILKKDVFWVPDMAILPFNWEKFFVNPVKGEDVPNNVGCGVEHFGSIISEFLFNFYNYLQVQMDKKSDSDPTYIGDSGWLTLYVRFMLILNMIFSSGSLPAALNENLAGILDYSGTSIEYFGEAFDLAIAILREQKVVFRSGNQRINISEDDSASDTRTVLEVLSDDSSFEVYNWSDDGSVMNELFLLLPVTFVSSDFPFNLRRCFAYQIACAHFFTNDKIDYVYSAELYRQLVYDSLLRFEDSSLENLTFEVNGLTYQYDYCSAAYFEACMTFFIDLLDTQGSVVGYIGALFDYLRLIFGYNRSLRYLDYFTGSRSQPLAVGDVTVAVNSNMVNVVDVAAKTMAAKMLNVANRIGQRIESYVKEFFHIEMAKDYHNPFWLAHTSDQIDNPENPNTGAAQYSLTNSITSIFRTGGNSPAIEFHPDRAGVIIGISYFDIQRVYPRMITRQAFHIDRYDDFLPYLQYVGDQTVSQKELDSKLNYSDTFGYQGRNMEYKQMVPYCFGGFEKSLAPYIFLANVERNRFDTFKNQIGPNYIRSLCTELDRFFTIINGYSLETYYHFAIVNNIYWDAVRPMAALPGILNG